MVGKAYTMREMRDILDYLNERKAYGELKGRRMWMEFANSNRTSRTWQSLKETFSKRILPDIQNPYYKQTMDQVRSFRAGEDVAEKEKKNRLEFRENKDLNSVHNVTEASEAQNEVSPINNDVHKSTKNNNEPPTTSIDEELEKVTGENIKAAKIPSLYRSSADTVILEYKNVEDVQRVLESPKSTTETQSKSLKDMITFEPLSPFVRDVIHDFETESETSDSEPRLKIAEEAKTNSGSGTIVEDTLEQNKQSKNDISNNDTDPIIEIPDSTDSSNSTSMNRKKMEDNAVIRETSDKDHQTNIVNHKTQDYPSNSNEYNKNETIVDCNETIESQSRQENVGIENTESNKKDTTGFVTKESNAQTNEKYSITAKNNNSISANTDGSTQSITLDSLLPNNQEALDSNTQKTKHDQTVKIKTSKENKHGKRSSSRDSRDSKKRKLFKSKENNNALPVMEIDDSSTTIISDTELLKVSTVTNKDNSNTLTSEEQFDVLLKQKLDDKPSTITERDVPDTGMNKEKITKVVKDKNTCTQNVSLVDESHSGYATKEHIDKLRTDKTNEIEDTLQKTNKRNEIEVTKNDVVEINLNSNSDCEIENGKVDNKHKRNSTLNLQRDRALANVFGFTHGGAPISNKRSLSHRRKSHQRRRCHSKNTESHSSEWTSQSDSDSYVSPPHGHRSRQTKKYLKPRSYRIQQDPDDGTLYVVVGVKVYPLVKNGKHVKKFVTYKPDSSSDEEDSFWKKKYIEEKRRNEDVRKLLKETQTGDTASTSKNPPSLQKTETHNENNENYAKAPGTETKTNSKDDKMVVKFAAKDGMKCHMEGDWNQISNAMPEMVKLMRCKLAGDNEEVNSLKSAVEQTEAIVDLVAGNDDAVTSAETENHYREVEIFKEIEDIAKFDDVTSKDAQVKDELKPSEIASVNVTKRVGRPRKAPSLPRVGKRTRSTNSNSTDSKPDEPKIRRVSKLKIPEDNKNGNDVKTHGTGAHGTKGPQEKQKDVNNKLPVRSNLRSSKQDASQLKSSREKTPVGTRMSPRLLRTPQKLDTEPSGSGVKLPTTASKDVEDSDQNDVRYMLPPSKTNNKSTGNKHRSLPEINIIPPHKKLECLVDSTYGYQDSDVSVMTFCFPKRKRRVSVMVRNKHKKRRLTRRSCPIILQASSDSNSSYFVPLRRSISSLNSEISMSDSYRLLMPKQKPDLKKLKRIDETNPNVRHFSSISKDSNQLGDIANSSNVSLPPSPELSIVENMSVSREIIKDANHPTINEVQQNVDNQPMDYSEFVISNLDVSVPLMDQRCKLQKNTDDPNLAPNTATECTSLKDCSVDTTLSETLDRRLRALLLESNKKSNQTDKQTPMEVDQTVVTVKKTRARKQKENTNLKENVPLKNTRPKKRSSTPQKKKTAPKSKAPQNPIIEEEHIESCAAGRKSCPAMLTYISIDDNANNNYEFKINSGKADRKKKDVIKVKILKPKNKKRPKKNLRTKSVGNVSVASTLTDSGINDTETISLILKDSSVDLIHNHSETCLMANECIDSDSVEYIENSSSLNSSRKSEGCVPYAISEKAIVSSKDTSNSLDNIGRERKLSGEIFESPKTKYHSPVRSNSSLITEDLSNSPASQSTRWYLIDEDITNMEPPNLSSFGSNLRQIFPIACAVPNLSTISEESKENEDSKKASDSLQQRLQNLLDS